MGNKQQCDYFLTRQALECYSSKDPGYSPSGEKLHYTLLSTLETLFACIDACMHDVATYVFMYVYMHVLSFVRNGLYQ